MWEYRIEETASWVGISVEKLNELGEVNWELVEVKGCLGNIDKRISHWIFKRRFSSSNTG